MTLRKYTLGMAVAAAALVPLSANADSIMNLPGSPNYNPAGSITVDFSGVTQEIAANLASGVNNGSCSVAGGNGACTETTYGAGVLNSVVNNISGLNLWSGGVVSGSNPSGSSIGFVIYGIADASVEPSGVSSETVDNTGANVAVGSDGKIHIDLYSMSAGHSPCFNAGCGANELTAASVVGVTNTSNSNVFNTATLFGAFTLQSGPPPLNAGDDGSTNPKITLTQDFNLLNKKGTANFYATCVSGPGCADFTPVTESALDATGTGFSGDPTYGNLITQIFAELNVTGPTVGETGAGWGLTVKDPVFAVDTKVPEPASLGLLGTGLAFLGAAIGRRRRKGISA